MPCPKRERSYPLEECARVASEARKRGFTVFQRWTCKHCRKRNEMAEPNVFFTTGNCYNCDQTSEITECNFEAEEPLQ